MADHSVDAKEALRSQPPAAARERDISPQDFRARAAPITEGGSELEPPLHVHVIAPAIVCWGLRRLILAAGGDYLLSGSSYSIAEALPLVESLAPDAVVVDLDDGCPVEEVGALYTRTRANILVLTSISDPSLLTRVLEAGARGFVHKREMPTVLLRAVGTVARGRMFATQEDTGRLFVAAARTALQGRGAGEASRIATLTLRERQTIAAVTSDAYAPVKVIASRLCISEHTLRNHLTSIYSKLGVSGRVDLHAYAAAHNLHRGDATRT